MGGRLGKICKVEGLYLKNVSITRKNSKTVLLFILPFMLYFVKQELVFNRLFILLDFFSTEIK